MDFATGKDGPTLTVRESKTDAGRRTPTVAVRETNGYGTPLLAGQRYPSPVAQHVFRRAGDWECCATAPLNQRWTWIGNGADRGVPRPSGDRRGASYG